MLRFIAYTSFVVASLVTTASASNAAQTSSDQQIVVSYKDLDISRPAGAEILIARMKVAASKVCGPVPDIRQSEMRAAHRHCMADVLDRAVASMDAPIVGAVYRESPPVVIAQN